MAEPARWLDRDAAAAYLSLTTRALDDKVRQGAIPAPSRQLGDRMPRWDRHALDLSMAGGIGSLDPHMAAQALVQEVLQGRR